MKKFKKLYCLALGFLFLNLLPCLSQAVCNGVDTETLDSTVQLKNPSVAEIIENLRVILLKDGPEVQVNRELQTLDLSKSKITDEDLKDLVEFIHEHFPNIKSLDLCSNNIGDAGAADLARLTQLKILYLGGNNIGDAGAADLAKLTQLEILYLGGNSISDVGAAYLARLSHLKLLELCGNNISNPAIDNLLKNIGNSVNIIYYYPKSIF
jgi:Leucine-rich repeat (LRR) protein